MKAVRNSRAIDSKSKQSDNDQAITDCTEAIRLHPNSVNAYDCLGNGYREKGDNDRAIADYNEAMRINPKVGYVYVDRGLLREPALINGGHV